MADGKGCKCAAYDESECACDADWTPQELIDARAEIARLRARPCPYVTGTVTKYCTLTPMTLTDAEREAVKRAAGFVEELAHPETSLTAAALRELLERLK